MSTSLDASFLDVLQAAIKTLEALKGWIEARDRLILAWLDTREQISVAAMQALDPKSVQPKVQSIEAADVEFSKR